MVQIPYLTPIKTQTVAFEQLNSDNGIKMRETTQNVINLSNKRIVASSNAYVQIIVPDIDNSTSVASVCATMPADKCKNWLSCCAAARKCCKRQTSIRAARPLTAQGLNGSTPWCSRTWDGFSCFDDTPPSSVVFVACPAYMPLADTSRKLFASFTTYSYATKYK